MTDSVFIKKVFDYHTKHGRHTLPWRTTHTPYAVLVSELMLQQTQVTRVIPKYNAWMKQYPTLNKLRATSLREVLVLWQGLGYQRRAKALYDIAKLASSLPKTVDELCALPGVGPYTASAVCAFAYNMFAHPVLETNIRTALIEAFHTHESSVDGQMLYVDLRRLEKNQAVQHAGARVWYSALMDYGAHLKVQQISHNNKVRGNTKQKPYKGSMRQLRAQVLFAITHRTEMPQDKRTADVLKALTQERFITKMGRGYTIS